MTIKSAPLYFTYMTQASHPIFKRCWATKLHQLKKDLNWIDELEKEHEETYSRDYDSDDFPLFHCWPQAWRDAYNSAEDEASALLDEHLAKAEVFKVDGDRIYILDEEVWFSTSSYNYGARTLMATSDHSDAIAFDSVATAAYAYVNDYNDWNAKYGARWEAANILSKSDHPFTDSLVGTTEECDGCGCYGKIVKEIDDIILCEDCAKKS